MGERELKRKKKLARRRARAERRGKSDGYIIPGHPAEWWIDEFPRLLDEHRLVLAAMLEHVSVSQMVEQVGLDRILPGAGAISGKRISEKEARAALVELVEKGFVGLVPVDPGGDSPLSKACLFVLIKGPQGDLVPPLLTEPGGLCPTCSRWFFSEDGCFCAA